MFLAAEIFVLLSCFTYAFAIPSWDGGFGTQPMSSIGSLVPGADALEALGPVSTEAYKPKYLGIAAQKGAPGVAVIYENSSPPLFYVSKNQLWQVTNQTSILQVNVLNVTETSSVPYRLVLGTKQEGVSGGVWRWRGTMLHYDLGPKTNGGLFYACQLQNGTGGVFMSLESMATPEGCQYATLHSFVRR